MNNLFKSFSCFLLLIILLTGCGINTSQNSQSKSLSVVTGPDTTTVPDITKNYWLEWNTDNGKEKPWMLWPAPPFTVTPTEMDIVSAYYSEKWREVNKNSTNRSDIFKLLEYKRIKLDEENYTVTVLPNFKTEQEKQAFDKYKLGLVIRIKTEGKFLKLFLAEGWKIITTE
ncbi:MAG: hypothetical protein WBP45_03650 [Daejeonella sp.]